MDGILIALWLINGIINMIPDKRITKFDYFCCWLVLMALLLKNILI